MGKVKFPLSSWEGKPSNQPYHFDFGSHPPLPISQGVRSHRRYWRQPHTWRPRLDICKERCSTMASLNHMCAEYPTTPKVLWETGRHKRHKPWALHSASSRLCRLSNLFPRIQNCFQNPDSWVWGDWFVVWPLSETVLLVQKSNWRNTTKLPPGNLHFSLFPEVKWPMHLLQLPFGYWENAPVCLFSE